MGGNSSKPDKSDNRNNSNNEIEMQELGKAVVNAMNAVSEEKKTDKKSKSTTKYNLGLIITSIVFLIIGLTANILFFINYTSSNKNCTSNCHCTDSTSTSTPTVKDSNTDKTGCYFGKCLSQNGYSSVMVSHIGYLYIGFFSFIVAYILKLIGQGSRKEKWYHDIPRILFDFLFIAYLIFFIIIIGSMLINSSTPRTGTEKERKEHLEKMKQKINIIEQKI